MPKTLPTPAPDRPEWAAKLSDAEERFVLEYIVDLNASQAAQRAGLGRTRASSTVLASKLRRKRHVAEAISALIAERYGATQSRVLEELAKLAFYDIGDAVTVEGGAVVVRDFAELDPDVRAAIVGVEERVNERGHRTILVKLADKNTALKTLAACLNMRRSPTDAPSVAVNVQVNNVTAASDRVLSRVNDILARQQALPAPTQQPMTIDVTPHREPVINA